MPKKMGVNSKAEAARTRRSAVEADRKERAAREKEEEYWRAAEGSKSRAGKKREEEAEKRAEAAARKAENRKLAEVEQRELEKAGHKPDRKASRVSIPAVPKVTEAELERRREEERQRILRNADAARKHRSRTAEEEEYERMVLVANTNRDDSVIEAHSVEDAIARMALAEPQLPPDRHPERRLKASFKAFEEAELPKLKEEKPGLTLNQYKDMIWKLWKKSPDNPLNQRITAF
ncbi:coiled-coil domain-containing protein [Cocos nucifera]|uniref:Coiled-coil domain-containing protein n=1 Tax=Cocos nucifera TaxID=13894 RepID=A0A8K0IGJ5_COCNU|nr:coiled-coil domain-containing protein [Cocos nucifera]